MRAPHQPLIEKRGIVREHTFRRLGSAVVVVCSLLGCGRTDKAPRGDSGAPRPASRSALVSPRPARIYPGALAKRIDDYSGDELFELVRGLQFAGSHERQRRCTGSPDCDGGAGARRTKVQVSAVATQDSLGPADVPAFGVIYARAINLGDATEARYGLRPGAALRYYMIVHRDSSGALRWRLEELAGTPPRRHVQVGSGTFQGCGHEQQWTPGARADFKTCEAAERGDTVVTLGLAMQIGDDPLWTSCGAGCCIY